MLCFDTRAMCRVLDVVWYDLSVTKAKGSVTYPDSIDVDSVLQHTQKLCHVSLGYESLNHVKVGLKPRQICTFYGLVEYSMECNLPILSVMINIALNASRHSSLRCLLLC